MFLIILIVWPKLGTSGCGPSSLHSAALDRTTVVVQSFRITVVEAASASNDGPKVKSMVILDTNDDEIFGKNISIKRQKRFFKVIFKVISRCKSNQSLSNIVNIFKVTFNTFLFLFSLIFLICFVLQVTVELTS